MVINNGEKTQSEKTMIEESQSLTPTTTIIAIVTAICRCGVSGSRDDLYGDLHGDLHGDFRSDHRGDLHGDQEVAAHDWSQRNEIAVKDKRP